MKIGFRVLIMAFFVLILFNTGDVNAQWSVEVNGSIGRTYYDDNSWVFGYQDATFDPFLRNIHVSVFPFYRGIISIGAELEVNYFVTARYYYYAGINSGGYECITDHYKAYTVGIPVRISSKDGLFAELSPGIYWGSGFRYELLKIGAVATAGFHLRQGKNLTIPVKIRAGIVLNEPKLTFLSGGIGLSYRFKAKT